MGYPYLWLPDAWLFCTGCVNGSRMAHPVTTPLRVVRRWVKSGDQVELAEVVLRLRGNGDLDVVLLDLWQLGTVLVVVAVTVAALDA